MKKTGIVYFTLLTLLITLLCCCSKKEEKPTIVTLQVQNQAGDTIKHTTIYMFKEAPDELIGRKPAYSIGRADTDKNGTVNFYPDTYLSKHTLNNLYFTSLTPRGNSYLVRGSKQINIKKHTTQWAILKLLW